MSSISVDDLTEAISEILREYGDVIYTATEDGLDAAERVLIDELRSASPEETGKFKKAWKSRGRKYKLLRIVGNTTTVKDKKGNDTALSNILEYSKKHGSPFVKHTFEENIDKMAAAVVAEIKKEA